MKNNSNSTTTPNNPFNQKLSNLMKQDHERRLRFNKPVRIISQFIKAINDNLKEGFECYLEQGSVSDDSKCELAIVIAQKRSQRLFGTLGDSRPWNITTVKLDYQNGFPAEICHVLGEEPSFKRIAESQRELEITLSDLLEQTYIKMVLSLCLKKLVSR